MALFPTDGALTPNLTAFGQPPAPNKATRVPPPLWTKYKIIRDTTSTEVVPDNVYQVLAMVWGAGGSSGGGGAGGGGGGFGMGVIDVTPGQLYPTLTIGGTSSFGSLISSPAGSGKSAGAAATIANSVRSKFSAAGGAGANAYGGGGASGSPFGTGGNGGEGTINQGAGGGGGWGLGVGGAGSTATTTYGGGGGGLGTKGGAGSNTATSGAGGGGGSSSSGSGTTGGGGGDGAGGTGATAPTTTTGTNAQNGASSRFSWTDLANLIWLNGGGGGGGITNTLSWQAGNGGNGGGGGGAVRRRRRSGGSGSSGFCPLLGVACYFLIANEIGNPVVFPHDFAVIQSQFGEELPVLT